MAFALSVLAVGSLFSGYMLKDAFVGIGSVYWGNSIYKSEFNNTGLDYEFIPLFIKNIPFFFSSFGILLAISFNSCLDLYNKSRRNSKAYDKVFVSYPQSFVFIV